MDRDPVRRLLGRALFGRGRWSFDPAKRHLGVRPLIWKGPHAPEDGDYVVAEVGWEGDARLIEVLGAEDRPQWDVPALLSQFRIRSEFPEAVLQEAAAFHEPGANERRGRLDLREEIVVTIDPADARDHDDALSVREVGEGRFEVGIHIADVSHYVRPGTALDDEAKLRGTSVYLPGAVVPMLPERLSADLCSLRDGVDRLALSVIVTLDDTGALHEYRFAASVIRSRASLSYEQVQESLDGTVRLAEELVRPIQSLALLARALRRRRHSVGALAIESVEIKAVVDEIGQTIEMVRRESLESHQLIEEFMLLANRCVGEAGDVRGAGVLYRIHEPPTPLKLDALDAMLKGLSLPRLGRMDQPHRALQGLLGISLEGPKKRLVHRLVLRSMPRARYLHKDLGHFGLATREYCHFTSPIRRYPDLHNHRRVREWIRGLRDEAGEAHSIHVLADQCTAREQDATDAEREATKVKGLRLMEGRLGERLSGSISGLTPRGFFVELDDPPVDGFVRIGHYDDDRFELDPSGVRLVGRRTRKRYQLGDAIAVVVARVDVPAREMDLAPVPTTMRRTGRVPRRQGWR